MKALTIRQPWASLIVCGAKTIETRSWSTAYRGDLLIHAGKARPPWCRLGGYLVEPWFGIVNHDDDCYCEEGEIAEACARRSQGRPVLTKDERLVDSLPLGAVVAVARLADVVPIVPRMTPKGDEHPRSPFVAVDRDRSLVLVDGKRRPERIWEDRTGDLPLGDFTPGRYAWLLTDVRPIDPVPAKGRQGLWTPDQQLALSVNMQAGQIPGAP